MPFLKKLSALLLSLLYETYAVAKDLFAILIPAVIVVKVLQELGAVAQLARAFEPLMQLFGLPGELAIVWTTAIIANIYGSIAVFMMVAADLPLTVAQSTVLWTMVLVCHSLPVELALTHRVGGHFLFLGLLRFFGACVLGFMMHKLYFLTGTLDDLAVVHWSAAEVENSLSDWVLNQLNSFVFIVCVLFCMLSVMRFLNFIKFTDLMGRVLNPLLVFMGISKKGAPIAVFGLLAGITFGSGLLIAEIKKGSIPWRDVVLVLSFLSLCHGIVEDTAVVMLMGSDFTGVLIFRLLFAMLVLAILSRVSVFDLSRISSARIEEAPELGKISV